jgi:hypothetical protein
MTRRLASSHVATGLALGIALAGCADQAPQPMPPPMPAISYDGTYTGTISVSGAATSVNESECATDPRFSVNVADNQFSFPLPHRAVSRNTPSLRRAATPVYNASIGPEGTIKGLRRRPGIGESSG